MDATVAASLATLWALANVWGIRRRRRRERRGEAVYLGLILLGIGLAWVAPALSVASLGSEIGLGAVIFWGLSEMDQTWFLGAAGISLGVALYYWGWLVLPGGVAGGGLGGLVRSLQHPPTLTLDARIRDPHFQPYGVHVILCSGEACKSRGADVLRDAALAASASPCLRWTTASCLGYCREAPVLWLEPEGRLLRRARLRDVLAITSELPGSSPEG